MDAELQIGRIHIIEWLAEGDARTGWELYNEIEPLGLVSKPTVEVRYSRVRTRAEFIAYLRTIHEEMQTTRRVPLLHIETHGYVDGLGATDSDEVTWPDLMAELIPINVLTALRLVLVVAACEGLWALQTAQPVQRAAFLALLGPNRPVTANELSVALQTFYRRILTDKNGTAAIQAMNEAIDPNQPAFGIVNAEMLFKDVLTAFLADARTDTTRNARIEKIVAECKERFRRERGVGMWAHEVQRLREAAREEVEAHREQFEHYRRTFFMIDLYPANDRRFPIAMEDCIPNAG